MPVQQSDKLLEAFNDRFGEEVHNILTEFKVISNNDTGFNDCGFYNWFDVDVTNQFLFELIKMEHDEKQRAEARSLRQHRLYQHCDGNESPRRHLICVLTEHPGNLPPELPAYNLSFDGCPDCVDLPVLQHTVGELTSSLIRLLENSDRTENIVTWALKETSFVERCVLSDGANSPRHCENSLALPCDHTNSA